MTRNRATLLLLAALALGAGALLASRGRGGEPAGSAPPAPEGPPGSAPAAPEPPAAGPGPAPGNGWSRSSPGEVNAAGLARAASRREEDRRSACPPAKDGERAEACEPERGPEAVEIDWNGRRANP